MCIFYKNGKDSVKIEYRVEYEKRTYYGKKEKILKAKRDSS